MKILALETSTQRASVAVLQDGTVLAEEFSFRSRSHSEVISPFVDAVLNKASLKLEDIDCFAVGQGPGSFTGIRVAANVGKSFAYSYNKPLVTVDSLLLLAAQVEPRLKPVAAMINAYKNMVYLGVFDISGDEPKYLLGPLAVPVRELSLHIKTDVLVLGDGWEAFHKYFPEELRALCSRDESLSDHPQASTLAKVAEKRVKNGQTLDWKSFIPLYIRSSEAEENKRGLLISPLK